MFRLAHLSDPHLAPMPRPRLRDFNLKRLFGFINWHHNRRQLHLSAVLERIVADLKDHKPEHIAVTGDLVNISLAAEFGPARAWLEQLGTAQDVTLVPGNHDIYLRSTAGHAPVPIGVPGG
jgi:3',5'-cyclic AMP phosphodiesterase CpdA